ncbi:J domain-containing protein [Candidatus Nucleicultrix amoebiphila]|jgi:DnaJ-domain-containing protein 1|uniref:J domain-containing protein n=1 Tax=Candidatus Nucleicultrix amoebiphila TaxID=1509244 RepID=UPI000A268112|nr:DnaJ domain-containing protein [Candidatus Nucleicultrix amoebiphila]
MTSKYRLHSFFDSSSSEPEKICDHQGCTEEGIYKAPQSPEALNSYYWFCLEHVRHYNAQWNFYKNRAEQEIETLNREDNTWQRPTWRFGMDMAERTQKFGFHDPHNILGWGKYFSLFDQEPVTPNYFAYDSEESRALSVLQVDGPITPESIKSHYLILVKKYHPDANGGCTDSEEKLKTINRAYEVLKKFLAA